MAIMWEEESSKSKEKDGLQKGSRTKWSMNIVRIYVDRIMLVLSRIFGFDSQFCRGIFIYWRIIPQYVRTGRFYASMSLVHILYYVFFGGGPCVLLTTAQEKFPNCMHVPICDPKKFQKE